MASNDVFGLNDSLPVYEFGFTPTEKVKYGPGAVNGLAEEVDRLGASRALIVTGTTLATKTDLVDRMRELLGERCVGVFSDAKQHVPRSTVIEAIEVARQVEADIVISFGGGSPIDTTKLVALGLAAGVKEEKDMDALRFGEVDGKFEFPPIPDSSIPHIAISTTLSAGEFTPWGGGTDTARGVKDGYGAPHITPRVVFLDPELAAETPAWLWGTTGLKAFDHAIETVCSTKPQPIADALALRAIELLIGSLAPATADPSNVEARGLCQVGAWMSILSLPSIPAGLSHALGHQLGAHCDVPHGVTSCIVLPAVMDFNTSASASRQRLVAEAMGIDTGGMDDEAAAAAASDRLRRLVEEIGVTAQLREWGVTEADLRPVAADAIEDVMGRTNPRKVESEDQVVELLRSVY